MESECNEYNIPGLDIKNDRSNIILEGAGNSTLSSRERLKRIQTTGIDNNNELNFGYENLQEKEDNF